MSERQNLSATRGSSAGIRFFRVFMRLFGLKHACNFVWFVVLFYALFDRRANRAALPYVQLRFPEARGFTRWLHCYRLMASQGEALLIAGWIGAHGWKFPHRAENRDGMAALLADRSRGFVMVTSHFGCWQAALAGLAGFGRTVNLLAQPDAKAELDKRMAVPDCADQFKLIPADGFMGGLLECIEAVRRGEVVCVMGDRVAGGASRPAKFFGGAMEFPLSPWLVAARSGCPVVPLFIAFEPDCSELLFRFGDVIRVSGDPDRRVRPEELAAPMAEYARGLENMARRYPYQVFRLEPD